MVLSSSIDHTYAGHENLVYFEKLISAVILTSTLISSTATMQW